MLEPPGFTIDKPAEPARTIEFVRVSIQLLMTTSLVYRAMRYHPASSGCVTEEYPCSISPGSSTRSTHVHGDDEFFGSVKTAEDLGSDLESFDKAGQTSIHLLFVLLEASSDDAVVEATKDLWKGCSIDSPARIQTYTSRTVRDRRVLVGIRFELENVLSKADPPLPGVDEQYTLREKTCLVGHVPFSGTGSHIKQPWDIHKLGITDRDPAWLFERDRERANRFSSTPIHTTGKLEVRDEEHLRISTASLDKVSRPNA